ncbi:hypothetical protein EUBSIR_01886 [[Eubacterium] siraeum DSM 15702]|uniref:Uncharacterized protein n=1 Tax=[Eubacterium] siraeum DSM 15702 TaxID=428128 RepID=B0MPT3_9FIRM|nr:hypothetical protein EUBSIR_01886 [[Eubacterium] siraeum DSM 15702]
MKCVAITAPCAVSTSPSSRGRGLKSLYLTAIIALKVVALFTRAWIEIIEVF